MSPLLVDANTAEAITWTLSTIVTVCVIIGLAVRFVLMPYLREHLVAPLGSVSNSVKQVEKQVTENSHKNAEPTVLDRIDDVRTQVTGVHDEVSALARVIDGHMDWSERWVGVIERELDELRRRRGDDTTEGS